MNNDNFNDWKEVLEIMFKEEFINDVNIITDENNEELCITIGFNNPVYNTVKNLIQDKEKILEDKINEYNDFIEKVNKIKEKRGF